MLKLSRLVLLFSLAPAVLAVNVTAPEPDPAQPRVYRTVLVLQPPRGVGMSVEDGVILTWNRYGRLIYSHHFSRDEFATWSAGRSTLGIGQQLVFTHQQSFPGEDEPTHSRYVFRVLTTNGDRLRYVKESDLTESGDAGPATLSTAGADPAFEVYVAPDRLVALEQGRLGRHGWGFSIWLQETNGVPVELTQVHWMARTAAGELVAEDTLDTAAITAAAGSAVCGPDGILEIPGLSLVPEGTMVPSELVVMANGRAQGQGISALGRFPLEPPAPRPATSVVRLPFHGVWRVVESPGRPWTGQFGYTWVFDLVDGQGQPFRGDGGRPSDHYAWNQPVLAPGNGTVVEAIDMFADAAQPVIGGTFAGAAGENHLLINHGNGEFSYLAPLQNGSLQVRAGQTVTSGQAIARVGSGAYGRPVIVYRLLRFPEGETQPDSIAARFADWRLVGDEPQPTLPTAPLAGDRVQAP